MKKKIILILGLMAFIVGLLLINNYMNNREISNENEIVNVKTKTENESKTSKVIEVTSKTFEKEVINCDKPVLIDFYADWCPPCKKLSPIVEKVASENSNVKFVKINIDDEEELANKYNISSIPTLVLIKNGEETNRSIGLISKDKVEELINNLT